jgi:nucleotide-binding universal stress UspA family protein
MSTAPMRSESHPAISNSSPQSVPMAIPRKILFATDFSRQSNLALRYALPIARKYKSKVFAVHITPAIVGLPESAREGLRALGYKAKVEFPDELNKLEEDLSGIPHEIRSKKGDVWSELSAIVEKEQIDLVVAGTHGRSGVGKLLLGSVAEKIFRRAPCPVLTVGPAVSGETDSIVDLHEILFATDLSDASMAAVPHAVSLAQENHSRLYILHTLDSPATPEEENALKDRLRNIVPRDANLISQPKVFVEYGQPAERILAVAEELAIDLIVLAVRRTPVIFEAAAHLPVATAYKVITQAICPVLTVREPSGMKLRG